MPQADTQTDQAVAAELDPARVMVQDNGAEPRQELRFHDVESDQPQQVNVTVGRGLTQSTATEGEVDTTAPQPPAEASALDTRHTLPLTAATVPAADGDQGTRRVEFRVGATPSLEQAEGFESGWTADDAGEISTVRFAAPTDADDATRAATEEAIMHMVSLPVVFPDEPVGAGAQWSVDSRVTGQATMLQTTTYTVADFDGERVKLEVTVQQRPALGALELPDEGKLEVDNSNTSSRGELVVDLRSPLPVTGSVAATTRVVYEGDSAVRIVQDTTNIVAFDSEDAGDAGH